MLHAPAPSIAVVGAGVAGCRAAQALAAAGASVTLLDKSRGPGGRLATRLQRWRDATGQERVTAFDHGAPGFAGNGGAAFLQDFVTPGLQEGWLARWQPRMRAGDPAPLRDLVALSPQPQACWALLAGTQQAFGCTVHALEPTRGGWLLRSAESEARMGPFQAVLLTLPPAQASALLAPVAPDWARQAALVALQPCWTLMAVTDTPFTPVDWAEAAPALHPLIARVSRQDARPGREAVPGEAHWVVHAGPAWSRTHVEDPADAVRDALQEALESLLGERLRWRLALAHRWRYAQAPAPTSPSAPNVLARGASGAPAAAWWHDTLSLGLAGDWLGGGGVPGAWRSGNALAQACWQHGGGQTAQPAPFPQPHRTETP